MAHSDGKIFERKKAAAACIKKNGVRDRRWRPPDAMYWRRRRPDGREKKIC
jgi:hypothetical protein